MLSSLKIFWNSLKMALQELRVNKLRTFLSLLGITIGIFCIIAVLTVTESMETSIRKDLNSLGTNVIYVEKWPWDGGGEWWQYVNRPQPKFQEVRQIKDKVGSADAVTFTFSTSGRKVEFGSDYMDQVALIATSADLDKMQTIELAAGRYFSPSEFNSSSNAVVLGWNIADGLFGNVDAAVGKEIRVSNRKCRVIGVLKRKGDSMIGGVLNDDCVLLNYLYARTIVDERNWNTNTTILVRSADGIPTAQMKDDLTGAMRAIRRLKPADGNDFALNEITTVQGELTTLFTYINAGGWLIAAFALLVGGFGIANIMFVTVKERTNIIGLKKAIGARPGVILTEFLIESMILCMVGGGLGLLFVYGGALIARNMFSSFQIGLSVGNILLGFSISGIVGIIAGFIPAYTASKLDPVVAIRSN
ncbi:ABC transporter permease [Chitinophaga rhizosphaerae]|uniref:ABC transporter permease n=1 Tax=Chitinophaga rhizosphaerae TaxID=1864947 RepID=UPI0013DEAB87|nr:ABC transporter permease [Chitinophaga rhizosphaerae]